MSGSLSDNDKANLILKNQSFKDLLAKNPGGDTLKDVLTIKGDYFFNLLRSKTGIDEFKDWFAKYIDDHKFKRVDISKFNNDIKNNSALSFILISQIGSTARINRDFSSQIWWRMRL